MIWHFFDTITAASAKKANSKSYEKVENCCTVSHLWEKILYVQQRDSLWIKMVRIGFGQRRWDSKNFGWKIWIRIFPPDHSPPPPPAKKRKKQKQKTKQKKRVMHLQCCCFPHTPYLFLDATVRRRQRGQYITKRFNERKKCLCTCLNIWGNCSTVLCEKNDVTDLIPRLTSNVINNLGICSPCNV